MQNDPWLPTEAITTNLLFVKYQFFNLSLRYVNEELVR